MQIWIKEIFDHNGQGAIPLVILGNNIDLRDSGTHPDSITDDIAFKFCEKVNEQTKERGFEVLYFPFSTENKDNADFVFDHLAREFFSYLERK